MRQPCLTKLRRVDVRTLFDLDGPPERAELQVIADLDSTPLDQRFRQRDLEFAGDFCHDIDRGIPARIVSRIAP
jgi:hypothetical protein